MEPTLNVLTVDDWKAKEKKNEAPADAVLRKGFTPAEIAEVDAEERTLRFVISTESPDRDRDTIHASGWRLDNYRKNPVVLFGHMYREPPVGQALSVAADTGKLVSIAKFATREEYAFADTIYRLLLGKYLRATSVGFQPQEWSYDEERGGYNFIEQELLEYSIVPVPANPEALMLARSKGINITPLKDWAERMLDQFHEEKGVYVPQSKIIRLLEIVENEKTQVPGADVPSPPAPAAPAASDKSASPAVDHKIENGKSVVTVTYKDAAGVEHSETHELAIPAPETHKSTDDEDVLTLTDDEPDEKSVLDFNADELRDMLKSATNEAVAGLRTALTGRLD